MQHSSVKDLFKEQIKHYSHEDQSTNSELIELILEWIKKKKIRGQLKICEYGGGAGQLLNEIRKSHPKADYTNAEIVNEYREYLVSKQIKFVNDSILGSKFAGSSFDVLIVRDVLHHLIGESYKGTLENQMNALKELKRLCKPKGAIFIEELTNESDLASRIIYYLTLVNSKIRIKLPGLFVTPNVIVAFLTSKNLLSYCYKVFGKEKLALKKINEVHTKWYIKLLHLNQGIKKVTLIIRN